MATINLRALEIAIERPVDRACRQIAQEIAQERFDDAKENFLNDFLSHPISQEIEAGAKTEGDILPAEGNLFSFIGFEDGEDPIGDLYDFLNQSMRLGKTPVYDKVKKQYIYKVYAPSKESIKDQTPMPWGTARSWVFAIESGISGLNHYLFSRKRDLGRSTGGIQSKGIVNDASYRPQKYFSELLNSFIKNL